MNFGRQVATKAIHQMYWLTLLLGYWHLCLHGLESIVYKGEIMFFTVHILQCCAVLLSICSRFFMLIGANFGVPHSLVEH